MKYGENLFSRRETARNVPPMPSAANQPAATPAIVASNRPGEVKAAATPAPSHEAPVAKEESAGGSKLIVGPNIKLRGVEIDNCDTLVVEGRVEATMVSRAIQVAEHGAFSGKVDVDVAEIRGEFQGEMTARSKLVIHATGRVSGKIRYGKMLVQEGGEMSGDIGALKSAGELQPVK
ncbi:MAG: bactofilin family protein [Betaproteobacteria bacterium]